MWPDTPRQLSIHAAHTGVGRQTGDNMFRLANHCRLKTDSVVEINESQFSQAAAICAPSLLKAALPGELIFDQHARPKWTSHISSNPCFRMSQFLISHGFCCRSQIGITDLTHA
ncbi:hypothetical protein [Dyella sp.]|jgi:hypothetical protein|uniref:hypothetical protein n=1 Tax=Dyella sp. TaxID=1869338 RepID=UPI002FD94595